MSLDPILSAPVEIRVHVVAAMLAMILGPFALYRERRDRLHRVVGYVWVASMVCVAISGFFIEAVVLPIFGPFGPIQLFSVWALVSLWQAMAAIYRRDIARHRAIMRALYWQALGLAGLLTLLPGRRMNEMLFSDSPMLGLGLALVIACMLALRWVLGLGLRETTRFSRPK